MFTVPLAVAGWLEGIDHLGDVGNVLLQEHILADLHQDIVINVRRAEPGATREYLKLILTIIDEIREREWTTKRILVEFGVKVAQEAYQRTIFHVSNPDIKLLLQLWD